MTTGPGTLHSPGRHMQHEIWRKVRRPFRYPCCKSACVWEVYDANHAGCRKCGRHHECKSNAVDTTCPLILCDDRTRVCSITGYILPEVPHADEEFCDTVSYHQHEPARPPPELNNEVHTLVTGLLQGERAAQCRLHENARQYHRLAQHMQKQLRVFKLARPNELPNVCQILAAAIQQERYWRFMETASDELVRHCTANIVACLLELRARGVKLTTGTRMQDLVCGLLFMLKHGLAFQGKVLLSAIPEVDRCLPHENKIEAYFGISSKVICMTENEVKLTFRESYRA